jgi:hypothetical protein
VATGLFAGTTAHAAGYYDSGYDRHRDYDAPGAYLGLGFGSVQYSEDGLDSITPTIGMLRLGVPLSRTLAIEGRAGVGLADASSGGYHVKVDSLYAAYVKGSLPLARSLSLYAVGGIAGVNLKRDFGAGASRDTGLSLGVGADIYLGGGAGLNLEWTRLPSGRDAGFDYTNTMATLGLSWRF